ncbi:SGNH/GDSL hydrolase family protein [bacterium]|nr:MAG: SGNH/GDSL hydrolase family protein [bacterium]
MNHLVLLGDSIFDNGGYVRPGEPDVIRQVQAKLPGGWQATLAAVDGDFVEDVAKQLTKMPPTATHLAISAGGNNALDEAKVLLEMTGSMAGALLRLAQIAERFQTSYRSMIEDVLQWGLPTMVCTIYEGNAADPMQQKLQATALKIFNDIILRQAIIAGLPVLDLRLVCDQPEDYANPIEPSAIGGDKIATGIVRIVTTHDFVGGTRQIYS